jgi:hypothetical protein
MSAKKTKKPASKNTAPIAPAAVASSAQVATTPVETGKAAKQNKKCRTCSRTRPAAEFRPQHNAADGLYPHCRECSGRRMAEARQARKATAEPVVATKLAKPDKPANSEVEKRPDPLVPGRETSQDAVKDLVYKWSQEMRDHGITLVHIDAAAGLFSVRVPETRVGRLPKT